MNPAPAAAPDTVRPRRRPARGLAHELMAELTRRIQAGELSAGDKLPTESEIVRERGVSRTVVREAISRLQAAGLVETRHGIGSFVLATPSQTQGTLRAKLAAKSLQPSSDTQPLGEHAGPDMRRRTRILARALAAGTPKAQ